MAEAQKSRENDQIKRNLRGGQNVAILNSPGAMQGMNKTASPEHNAASYVGVKKFSLHT